MRLQDARQGNPLKIKEWPIEFSFWPMTRSIRRYGLQFPTVITNPWAIIRSSIQGRCPSNTKSQALAFSEQAEDYYKAATMAGVIAAKPVLIYYCFMNLVKAYILVQGHPALDNRVAHGLSEKVDPGTSELLNAYMIGYPSTPDVVNLFDKFLEYTSGVGLANSRYEVVEILPQILQAHRLWCVASDSKNRFTFLKNIALFNDSNSKTIWLNLFIYNDDLKRENIPIKKLLDETHLQSDFRQVKCNETDNGREIIQLEQIQPMSYTGRPSDIVPDLVNKLRPYLWTNALSIPPYREYYLYRSPSSSVSPVLPQLLSIYGIFYYLGSVTRYRPHKFDEIIDGKFGAQLQELINNMPNQFIYLLASEFAQQEITRSASV